MIQFRSARTVVACGPFCCDFANVHRTAYSIVCAVVPSTGRRIRSTTSPSLSIGFNFNAVNDVIIFLESITLYEGVHSRPLPRAEALVDPDFKTKSTSLIDGLGSIDSGSGKCCLGCARGTVVLGTKSLGTNSAASKTLGFVGRCLNSRTGLDGLGTNSPGS